MTTIAIPNDVLATIRKVAQESWDDAEIVAECVEIEVNAYRDLTSLEFGEASGIKQEILKGAAETADSWEDRLRSVRDQIEAYHVLLSDFDAVSVTLVAELRAEAARDYAGDYESQRDYVVNGILAHQYVEALRERVGPISDLLIKMEQIVGSECYNGHIQNYGPGGVWTGEGRSFRYPVKFLDGKDAFKRRNVSADTAPEVLITGKYQIGSNELSIFRALVQIVEMIERDYGVSLADSKLKKQCPA